MLVVKKLLCVTYFTIVVEMVVSAHVFADIEKRSDESVASTRILEAMTSLDDNFRHLRQRLTAFDQRFTSLDQQMNSLDHRLTSLDQRLSSLDSRVTSLNYRLTSPDQIDGVFSNTERHNVTGGDVEIMEMLDGVKKTCADVHNATRYLGYFAYTAKSTSRLQTPFRFVRVTRESTADHHTVSVTYEGTLKPDVYLKTHPMAPPVYVPVTDHTSGVVEVQLNVKDSQPVLLFHLPDLIHSLRLHLQGEGFQEQQLPNAHLVLQPGSDVTYREEDDVGVNVTVTFEGSEESIMRESVDWSTSGVSVSADTASVTRGDIHTLPPSTADTRAGAGGRNRTYRLHIDTNTGSGAGFTDITADFYFRCSRPCLLRELTLFTNVLFYRENLRGPFPDDFMAFVENMDQVGNKQFCQIVQGAHHNPCLLACEAVGDGVTSLELSRVLPDGHVTSLNYVTLSLYGYRQVAQFLVDDVTFSDAGEYKCTARSRTREVSRVIRLEVVQVARIVRDMSSLTILFDGSLKAQCTAEGTPAPNITFEYGQTTATQNDVIVTQLNSSMTMAEMKIPKPAAEEHKLVVICKASNGMPGNYDTFSLLPAPTHQLEFFKSHLQLH